MFPTETVYGVGASVRQPDAAFGVFALKQRPADMPLMLHVRGVEAVEAFSTLDGGDQAARWIAALASAFWPGPLTFIVPAQHWIDRRVLGGGDTVALRAPDHGALVALLDAIEKVEHACPAIAGTSANPHGQAPPTTEAQARAVFAQARPRPEFLPGGDCEVGVPSTILRVDPERFELLRVGAIDADAIARVCGHRPKVPA